MPFLDFLCVTFSGFAATRVDFTSIVTLGFNRRYFLFFFWVERGDCFGVFPFLS